MREERAAEAVATKLAKVPQKSKPVAGGPPAKRNGTEKIEKQIEEAEAALRAVEEELADPAAWSTPARSAESSARHEAAKRAVDELYEQYLAIGGVNT